MYLENVFSLKISQYEDEYVLLVPFEKRKEEKE